MALLLATFFLASAGASSAYLTVSEIFPMETRALAIAFFYAIGTAIALCKTRSWTRTRRISSSRRARISSSDCGSWPPGGGGPAPGGG